MKRLSGWAKRLSSAQEDPAPQTVSEQRAETPPPAKTRTVAFISPVKPVRDQPDVLGSLPSRHGDKACYSRSVSLPTPPPSTSTAPNNASAQIKARVSDPIGTARPTSQPVRQHLLSFSAESVHGNRLSNSDVGHDRSISPYSNASTSYGPSSYSALRSSSRTDQIVAPLTWAEMSNAELVANLGERERTRQEVLWEIVGSEERYVQELASLKECYVDPLLRPDKVLSNSPPALHTSPALSRITTLNDSYASEMSWEELPIASKFSSSLRRSSVLEEGNEDLDLPEIAVSPSLASPPLVPTSPRFSAPILHQPNTSFRHSKASLASSTKRTSIGKAAEAVRPGTLPENLRIALEVVTELLERHEQLSLRLRERYAEQYPLVRTLADVWANQRWIVQSYSVYVLHLEKALQEANAALKQAMPLHRKDRGSKEDKALGKYIMRLEEEASARGEPGLVICLSKPFQRLLKYPLLFQNLLWHTDPATADYAAARNMAIEIDQIMRSIEDEKVNEEEREKTRDIWARIEGVTDQTLAIPKRDRLLIDERRLWQESAAVQPDESLNRSTREKRTSRRLSGLLSSSSSSVDKEPSVGSKRDIWLISFTDVVVRCQRTGLTRLPRVDASMSKPLPLPEHQQRNLYRFLRVERWTGGVRDLQERRKLKSNMPIAARPDLETSESRMSFAYSGDEARPTSTPHSSISPSLQSTVGRGGSANAKFSSRLRTSWTPSSLEASTAASRAKVAAAPPRTVSPLPSALRTSARERSVSSPADTNKPLPRSDTNASALATFDAYWKDL